MSAIEFNQLRTQLRCTASIIDKFDRRKYRFSDFICSCRRQLFLGRENRPATNRYTARNEMTESIIQNENHMRILSWLWRREKKAWLTPLVDWAFCCCLTSDACTSHTPAPAHDKNVGQQHVWSRVFFVFLQYPKTYLRLCVWKVFGDWNWRVDTLCASQLTNNTIIELLSCLIGLDGRLDWFECVIGRATYEVADGECA